MKNILLIGGNGELGKRIIKEIEKNLKTEFKIDSYDIDSKKTLSDVVKEYKKVTTVIVSPPSTHANYIQELSTFSQVELILCEKPLPVFKELEESKTRKRIRIVDHYLLKMKSQEAIDYFHNHKDDIVSIDLSLCEPRKEHRFWMFKRSQHGGTIYDLGHHLVALTGKFFGFEALKDVINLQVSKFETYARTEISADKRATFSFNAAGYSIRCKVGQELETNKEVTFYLTEGEKTFSLDDTVEYSQILENNDRSDSMMLTLSEAACVSHLLERIVAKGHAKRSIAKIQEKTGDDAIEILKDLNNKFLHRHQFYWSSFYKLFFYHLVLITLPAIVYYYLSQSKSIPSGAVTITCATLSTLILLFIWRSSLKETDKYLDKEEHRMKLVLERIREIYCAKYGINLYPEKKSLLNCDEIFEDLEKNKFSFQAKGVGSDFMFNSFARACRFGSLISFLYFMWLSISLFLSYIDFPNKFG